MIPRIIHYVWLGENLRSSLVTNCIESWHNHLPEYEIIEWNENNSPINNSYVEICMRFKQWAFASDYIRLYVLYHYGGIYLDTDMEVCKPLPEFLLHHSLFSGYQDSNLIGCGIIACEAKLNIFKDLLDIYETSFLITPIPQLFTFKIHEYLHKSEIFIAPTHFFYPFSYNKKWITSKDKNEYFTVHHWNSSWTSTFNDFQKDFFMIRTGDILPEKDKIVIIDLYQNRRPKFNHLCYRLLKTQLSKLNLNNIQVEVIISNYFKFKYIYSDKYTPLLLTKLIRERKIACNYISTFIIFKLTIKSILFYHKGYYSYLSKIFNNRAISYI